MPCLLPLPLKRGSDLSACISTHHPQSPTYRLMEISPYVTFSIAMNSLALLYKCLIEGQSNPRGLTGVAVISLFIRTLFLPSFQSE